MATFIKNGDKSIILKERISQLVSCSKEMNFLVGFFYFSGIKELYESLKNRENPNLKVLVGLNIDQTIHSIVEADLDSNELSRSEMISEYFDSVKKSINSDTFDSQEKIEQILFFIELIKNKKLIIRKTIDPNHAKLYLFELDGTQISRNKLFITGSSNLTRAGLKDQNEFNIEIGDFGYEEAKSYFDGLWESAVEITEDDTTRERLVNTLQDSTHLAQVTPFEAYVLVLKNYLDSIKYSEISGQLGRILEESGYKPYSYQFDAVRQALGILSEYGGVIVADVVGLGKSIIAGMIAKETGKQGVIICPPGLMGPEDKSSGWRKYIEDFELGNWNVYSSGNLELCQEAIKNSKNIEVVIVDEAHRFRNQDTENYALLKNICRGRKVILLTATPFNNRPSDILSLLELFVVPKQSKLAYNQNIRAEFAVYGRRFKEISEIRKNYNSRDAGKKARALALYKSLVDDLPYSKAKLDEKAKYFSSKVRGVIEPVTIRRNRLDLQNNKKYQSEVKELSKLQNPQEWYYNLTPEQSKFYDEVLEKYFNNPKDGGLFTGAIYKPYLYEIGVTDEEREELGEEANFIIHQQKNLSHFMRRLMVKRFESSFGAFQQTIKNFEKINKKVLSFVSKTGKFVLDRSLIDRIEGAELEDIEEALAQYAEMLEREEYPTYNKIYILDQFKNKQQFLDDIASDINIFQEINEKLSKLKLADNDPKVKEVIKKIKEILAQKPKQGEPRRKIVLFTEFLDTVDHIEKSLKKSNLKKVLYVKGALSSEKIKTINENFDVMNKKPKDDYDILVSTDRVSEGFNLNRAGIVINYDIPWNPVRVIQRVGRINRISKKIFDELYIANFFPTEQGAPFNSIREIAQHKMFAIHNILGEDAKIFDVDEEPTPAQLFNRIQENPDELEAESFNTKAYRLFEEIKEKNPDIVEKINRLPLRVKTAKLCDDKSLIVFVRRGRFYILVARKIDENKISIEETTLENIIDLILSRIDAKREPWNNSSWELYEEVKKYKGVNINVTTENSLEVRARSVLQSLLSEAHVELEPLLQFIRFLSKDIADFGTLPPQILRKIAKIRFTNDSEKKKAIAVINAIKESLGDKYTLNVDFESQGKKEVIIAIENQ